MLHLYNWLSIYYKLIFGKSLSCCQIWISKVPWMSKLFDKPGKLVFMWSMMKLQSWAAMCCGVLHVTGLYFIYYSDVITDVITIIYYYYLYGVLFITNVSSNVSDNVSTLLLMLLLFITLYYSIVIPIYYLLLFQYCFCQHFYNSDGKWLFVVIVLKKKSAFLFGYSNKSVIFAVIKPVNMIKLCGAQF